MIVKCMNHMNAFHKYVGYIPVIFLLHRTTTLFIYSRPLQRESIYTEFRLTLHFYIAYVCGVSFVHLLALRL